MKTAFENINFLINELKCGNESAYKYLYSKFYFELTIYAVSLTNDEAKAKDIVQETFIAIWKQKDSLNIRSSIKNYLYKSVYNNFAMAYRKRKSELRLIEKLTYEALTDPWEFNDDVNEELINKIESLVDSLPPRRREIFLLSKKEGFLYKEIGKELNISVKTVEAQMSKAFAYIRNEIKIG